MPENFTNEPLLDMFLFETTQLLEQLEQSIISSERENSFTEESINEIFRIMHTIKGSASMMLFDNIATLAHSIEDLFFYLRAEKPAKVDCSALSDLVLEGVDFIKVEVEKIKNNQKADGNASELVNTMKAYLLNLKEVNGGSSTEKMIKQEPLKQEPVKQQYYISQVKSEQTANHNVFKAVIFFEEGCEMENIRAYTIIHNLKELTEEYVYLPENIIDSDESVLTIRQSGFQIYFKTHYSYQRMYEFLQQTIFLKDMELQQLEDDTEYERIRNAISQRVTKEAARTILTTEAPRVDKEDVRKEHSDRNERAEHIERENIINNTPQSIISVNVSKLDRLLDLVGEMVIAEAMVLQNPEIMGLELDNFKKAARQLHKITGEMQDMVMSIRMVPLSATFHKMQRIVRDMSKKLDKEVHLEILGEETEVDKNIIEHISDPLMHLVRNSIDHGIEPLTERIAVGKQKAGKVTIEARNAGSEVLIIVRDDGKGLNKDKILQKAKANNLLLKNEQEMSEKEIFNLILLPGFSTKENVTEFSGRGVGMDVVTKNIEAIGGSIMVDSTSGKGTAITLRIPLTLAIIDGMNIKVGNARYTIPTISIKESFRPMESDIIQDPDGNEMIMVRGECYQIRRLHELYKIQTEVTKFTDGIILMVEQDEKTLCVFADELIGQQQVVVKALPAYIRNFKRIHGLAGCTLLGDGSISLILDVARMFNLSGRQVIR